MSDDETLTRSDIETMLAEALEKAMNNAEEQMNMLNDIINKIVKDMSMMCAIVALRPLEAADAMDYVAMRFDEFREAHPPEEPWQQEEIFLRDLVLWVRDTADTYFATHDKS